MTSQPASGISVTCTPVYDGRYLFVQRPHDDDVLPGYWCFPGGKVHVGETIAGALVRELKEETGLEPTGRAFFVNSYLLGDRVGAHFAIEVTNNDVTLSELQDFQWISSVEDLANFTPRIPGIDNHVLWIHDRLTKIANLPKSYLTTRQQLIPSAGSHSLSSTI